MKLRTGITGEGITLRVSEGLQERLKPNPRTSQKTPARSYVYGHATTEGVLFYIGKGTGRRAWEDSRHPLWHRYVQKHLSGVYKVVILADNMSPDEAESSEAEWIAQESETLVNWINFGRKTDFEALDRLHKLRDANRLFIQESKAREKSDPEQAIARYYKAMHAIADYAKIKTEAGLIGLLLDEERNELGYSGEIVVLDRLTLLLIRQGRPHEAATAAEHYFKEYRADAQLSAAVSIRKRVARSAASDA